MEEMSTNTAVSGELQSSICFKTVNLGLMQFIKFLEQRFLLKINFHECIDLENVIQNIWS